MFPFALYILIWDGEWKAKQLWDDTQQSAKLGLTFFQIISLSLTYSSYTRLCCSFYLVLNKMLKVLRLNGTCCEGRAPDF